MSHPLRPPDHGPAALSGARAYDKDARRPDCVQLLFGGTGAGASSHATLPVFTSYIAPTILISPLSSISFRRGLFARIASTVRRTFWSATFSTNAWFFDERSVPSFGTLS